MAKSFANCGKLATVAMYFIGLLSLQFTKLANDIVCNKADLTFKNIILPTALLIQLVKSLTNLF